MSDKNEIRNGGKWKAVAWDISKQTYGASVIFSLVRLKGKFR